MFNLDIIKSYVKEREEEEKTEQTKDPNLTQNQTKIINLFNEKCTNTVLSALIGKSPYGVFQINPQKMDEIETSLKNGIQCE